MLAFLLGGNSSCIAASFVGVDVVRGKSEGLSGDIVEVRVLFYPGETSIELELRPIVAGARGQGREKSAIKSQGKYRDEQGFYHQTTRLRQDGGLVGVASWHVAYHDLDLENGVTTFVYEIVGRHDGKAQFAATSSERTLRITNGAWTVLEDDSAPTNAAEEPSFKAVIPDGVSASGYRIIGAPPVRPSLDDPAGSKPPWHAPKSFWGSQSTRTPHSDWKNGGHQYWGRHGHDHHSGHYDYHGAKPPSYGPPTPNRPPAAPPSPNPPTPLERESARLAKTPWVPRPIQTLYYATNRIVLDSSDRSPERFGDTVVEDLTYGSVSVRVPAEHVRGVLEEREWYELWADPEEYFHVVSINSLDKSRFLGILRPALTDNSRDVLLYVHGYNTSFEFAALRLAQFKNDIRFRGLAAFFSWPSAGRVSAYSRDEGNAAASVDALHALLRSLVQELRIAGGERKIHIVAHSMGSRIALRSLNRLSRDLHSGEKPIGHFVLAAPDIDVRTFAGLLAGAARGVGTITLYFNEDDRALKASRTYHLDSRLGEFAVFLPPLLNIDAQGGHTSVLGHDLFVSRTPLLVDLEMLINFDLPPRQRATLSQADHNSHIYWVLQE